MSLIRKLTIRFFLSYFIFLSSVGAEEIKKVGKFKDWEAVVYLNGIDKVCFAQSKPVLQSPKKVEREARLLRPENLIKKHGRKNLEEVFLEIARNKNEFN